MKSKLRDPGFAVVSYDISGLRFVNALACREVALEGFPYFDKKIRTLCRLPERILPSLPELLAWVCRHPSGGALRFRTDSRRICMRVKFETGETCVRTPWHALFGFDVYVKRDGKQVFVKTLYNLDDELTLIDGVTGGMPEGVNEWTVYFPVRNHPERVELGIEKKAVLLAPKPHRIRKPVLFYGSSIVEGGCASRSGVTYPATVGRALDAHVINFGFGGSARGEPEVADAIAALDLAAVVLDYDHNSPSFEHLDATHGKFFERIRAAMPRVPILILSSVNYHSAPEYFRKRASVIERTCRRARARGDRNVWFIHGKTVYPRGQWWDCSGDHLHPNDFGFRCLADTIGAKLKQVM